MKHILSSLILLLLYSCSNKPDLDGLWYVQENSLNSYKNQTFFSFGADKVIRLSNNKKGNYFIDTLSYTFDNSMMTIGDSTYSFSQNKDSITLSLIKNSSYNIVLIKTESNFEKRESNEILIPGRFHLTSNKSKVITFNLFPDSTYISNKLKCGYDPVSKCSLIEFDEYCFLHLNEGFIILIDSISDSHISFNIPSEQNSYSFKKVVLDPLKENSIKVIPEITKYDNFVVSYLDYLSPTSLQRVFIAIDKEKVNDTVMIQSIVCQIKELYNIPNKGCISFFSDIKYADYKDQLFFDENNSLIIGKEEAYENWMNYHYLAEFEFKSMIYSTFSACGTDYKRQKQININCN
jgi:hypothetical protein